MAGVDVPAIGACMIGTSSPSWPSNPAINSHFPCVYARTRDVAMAVMGEKYNSAAGTLAPGGEVQEGQVRPIQPLRGIVSVGWRRLPPRPGTVWSILWRSCRLAVPNERLRRSRR
jgi:hypothetical protein